MTIYIVMKWIINQPVPVHAWRTMTEATLDIIGREEHDRWKDERRAYTVVPVTFGGAKERV